MANQQEMTLQSIAGERLFEVPDYQRPYAWETKQLQDLWDDLDLMSSGRHYAGTLVLRQHEGEPLLTSSGTSLTVSDVVDGQQRLTTCFLLLDRLRRRFDAMDHEDAQETAYLLRSTYGTVTVGGVKRPKLQLGSELRAYWMDTILGDGPADVSELILGQRRLKAARDFFDTCLSELVKGLSAAEAFARLQALNARVASGLRFLVYEVGDKADVGVIFETLNERGRPLSEMDKIKNYLLYLARPLPEKRGEDLADHINGAWSDIFRHLASVPGNQEDTVLRAHWLATIDPRSREWKRTASVKAHFPRSKYIPTSQTLSGTAHGLPTDEHGWDRLVADVKDYVDNLKRCALFAADLHSPGPAFVDFTDSRSEAAQAQLALRRTGTFALFFPLLFATRLRHPHDGRLYAEVLRLCETYAARVFLIAQRRSNAGEPLLNYIASGLYQGNDPETEKASIRAATWEYANDERVRAALVASDNWYERRGHKYFLYEYERDLLSGTAKATLKPFEAFTSTSYAETTEHILPQNPSDGSPWWDDFTPEQHEQLRHTLGNLVLTHSNSAYSNHPYAVKRGDPQVATTCYARGAMAQERALAASYETWTPETIRHRQSGLAEWAMTRWPVAPPATGAVAQIEDEVPDPVNDDPESETEA